MTLAETADATNRLGRNLRFLWGCRDLHKKMNMTAAEHHIALTLASHMGMKGFVAHVSVDQLVAETGLHRATVYRAINGLEAKGVISKRSGTQHGTNTYTALMLGDDSQRSQMRTLEVALPNPEVANENHLDSSEVANGHHLDLPEVALVGPEVANENHIEDRTAEDLKTKTENRLTTEDPRRLRNFETASLRDKKMLDKKDEGTSHSSSPEATERELAFEKVREHIANLDITSRTRNELELEVARAKNSENASPDQFIAALDIWMDTVWSDGNRPGPQHFYRFLDQALSPVKKSRTVAADMPFENKVYVDDAEYFASRRAAAILEAAT